MFEIFSVDTSGSVSTSTSKSVSVSKSVSTSLSLSISASVSSEIEKKNSVFTSSCGFKSTGHQLPLEARFEVANPLFRLLLSFSVLESCGSRVI